MVGVNAGEEERFIEMDVSENSGFSPQIIHFNRVFHYKPSILEYCTFIFGNTQMFRKRKACVYSVFQPS